MVPAIFRFTVYSAVIIIIPDSRSRTLHFTWIRPVQIPARTPTRNAIGIVRYGLTPRVISAAVTAAPRGKLPSTVRSGKSRILYVI